MNNNIEDYSITWSYICDRMSSKFGIKVDDTERFSLGEIEALIDNIFGEYYEKKKEYYERVK